MKTLLLFLMILGLIGCKKDEAPGKPKYEIRYSVASSTLKDLWINTMAPDGTFPLVHCTTGYYECSYYSSDLPKDQALQISAYDTAAKTTDKIKIVIAVNGSLNKKEVIGEAFAGDSIKQNTTCLTMNQRCDYAVLFKSTSQ